MQCALSRAKALKTPFRVREEINLHFQESRHTHGKARGGRIASYLTDEQRSQAGWIGASKCEVIFERALSAFHPLTGNCPSPREALA
jgi:hypothetical protein